MVMTIWQITQQGEQFMATAMLTGSYASMRDWFDKNPPTKREPVTAPTLGELRTKLREPPYSVGPYKSPTFPRPPVIEEWA